MDRASKRAYARSDTIRTNGAHEWLRTRFDPRKGLGMKRRRMGMTSITIITTGTLLSCCCGGCGGPPEAGTISISKAKEAAALRGIHDKQDAAVPPPNNKTRAPRPRPTQALPKGGR